MEVNKNKLTIYIDDHNDLHTNPSETPVSYTNNIQ